MRRTKVRRMIERQRWRRNCPRKCFDENKKALIRGLLVCVQDIKAVNHLSC